MPRNHEKPKCKLSGDYVLLPLSSGKFVKINKEYEQWLSQWKWSYDRYAFRTVMSNGKKTTLRMHAFILDASYPNRRTVVDHINRDKLDNREENLRVVTQKENMANTNHVPKLYRYVYKKNTRNCYAVQIYRNGKVLHLSNFDDKNIAIALAKIIAPFVDGGAADSLLKNITNNYRSLLNAETRKV